MKHHIILFLLLLTYTGAAAQSPARTGKDYAVFFYVTDFQPGLKDLPDTKTEAGELAKELSDNYGFTCTPVAECTKSKIQDELKTWNQRLQPGDQVLFFFSMHGYYDHESDRGYLIAANGQADDQNNYFTSWLSYDDLRTYLAPCKAGHILVALDACYSGSFGIRSNKKPDDPAYNDQADCATQLAQNLKFKGRQFITAGKMTESVPGKSAFCRCWRPRQQQAAEFHTKPEARIFVTENPPTCITVTTICTSLLPPFSNGSICSALTG